VIDGGSSDDTVSLAKASNARVIEAGSIGLAKQRRLGYLATTCEFVAFVDADDRLDSDWLGDLFHAAVEGKYAALQSQLRAHDPSNFWTRGWNDYLQESVKRTSNTNMVGRPALFRTSALREIQAEPRMIIEDTEMSRTFELMGLRQGIGAAISRRICPSTYAENVTKWKGYGRGYRQFVSEHPERAWAIRKHILWTIPVVRSIRPVLRGNLLQPIFGFVMASSILRGYLNNPLSGPRRA